MRSSKRILWSLLLLAGCGGNPFVDDGGVTPPPAGTSVSELTGTAPSSAAGNVRRSEVKNKGPGGVAVTGNGFAEGYVHDPVNDSFAVDNLAFDGGNVYSRVGSLNGASVYAGAGQYPDTQTGVLIDQFTYRALYGTSTSGRSKFAIVRTGAYAPYGFGGFVYERNGSVVLPTTGQAQYTGTYSGLRDFNGRGGLQLTTGDMTMEIDFNDFNAAESATGNGAGIAGYVSNRRIYSLNGTDITAATLAEINVDKSLVTNPLTALPTLVFTVGPGVLDNNGEVQGALDSTFVNDTGQVEVLDAGMYYGVISGTNADEVVGVIVVTSEFDGYTARETGGFILYRP
ncbi:MAG: hypothetical protein RIR95_418 [Pseudomonadota bacterium]